MNEYRTYASMGYGAGGAEALDDEPGATGDDKAFPVVRASSWAGQPIREREWAVKDRVPMYAPSLISGEGAVGKTILLQQLAVAKVAGRQWLGTDLQCGPVIYLSAEEDEDEFHRRLVPIADHYHVRPAELDQLHVLCMAGKDAMLGTPDREGIIRPTELFGNLKAFAAKVRPRLVILDNAADVFAGKENDRAHVRQFATLLRGMAIDVGAAALLSSHPSLTGISTGTGLSGSTGWHNSFRARMVMKSVPTGDDDAGDGLRTLEMHKSNYGPIAEKITLRWQDGLFLPVGTGGTDWLEKRASDNRIDDLFVTLLTRFNSNGQNVTDKTGTSYAPAIFAKHDAAKGVKPEALARAMQRLLDARRIKIETFGPPSKSRTRLVVEVSAP